MSQNIPYLSTFQKYDKNNDGVLDAHEIKIIIEDIQKQELEKFTKQHQTTSKRSSKNSSNSKIKNINLSDQKDLSDSGRSSYNFDKIDVNVEDINKTFLDVCSPKQSRNRSSHSNSQENSKNRSSRGYYDSISSTGSEELNINSTTNLQNSKNTSVSSQVSLTFEDFISIIKVVQDQDRQLREKFNFFDKNGDGKISKKELKKSLTQLKEKHDSKTIKMMMKDADLNGDGEIDFDEFKAIMMVDTQKS